MLIQKSIETRSGLPRELHIKRRLPGGTRESIEEQFQKFHSKHPEVMAELVRFARQVKARGRKRYSIEACYQRVRWYFDFENTSGETYKLNNNYRSRYARLIEQECPDLRGFFETRQLRSA